MSNRAECLTLEDSLKIARIIEEAGADAIQVRSQWIGRHDSSFLTDHLFYPEPPVPLASFPKELDMSRHGAGANANMAQAVKEGGLSPRHHGGQTRSRPRRRDTS